MCLWFWFHLSYLSMRSYLLLVGFIWFWVGPTSFFTTSSCLYLNQADPTEKIMEPNSTQDYYFLINDSNCLFINSVLIGCCQFSTFCSILFLERDISQYDGLHPIILTILFCATTFFFLSLLFTLYNFHIQNAIWVFVAASYGASGTNILIPFLVILERVVW